MGRFFEGRATHPCPTKFQFPPPGSRAQIEALFMHWNIIVSYAKQNRTGATTNTTCIILLIFVTKEIYIWILFSFQYMCMIHKTIRNKPKSKTKGVLYIVITMRYRSIHYNYGVYIIKDRGIGCKMIKHIFQTVALGT